MITMRLSAFSRGERGLTTLLIVLVLDLFVAYPSSPAGFVLDGVSRALLTLVLVAGSASAVRRPHLRALVVCLFAATIVANWATLWATSEGLDAARYLLTLSSLVVICGLLLAEVSRSGPVTAHRIRGAIAGYLLIAATFGYAYAALETLRSGAFALPPWTSGAPRQAEVFYYFSIVTLTTIGFGDILPVHPVARSLVMVEGLIGQLYPVILIARLVSLQIETTRSAAEKRGDDPRKS